MAALLPVVAACASVDSAAGRRAVESELRAATAHYAELVARMDSAAIAALFTEDGEVAVGSQPPTVGRAAILRHLESFRDFHVLAERLTAERIRVQGGHAEVSGSYEQQVRVPAGEVLTVHGSYTASWTKGAGGAWQIRRMVTTPA